jgi:hypothetical protein
MSLPVKRPTLRFLGATIALATAASIGAFAVFLGLSVVADHLVAQRLAHAGAAPGDGARIHAGIPSTAATVNRERKTDPLPAPQHAQARRKVQTVEVIGVRDTVIVYRDREGKVLFRTDPVANVTVVAKNVELPEITVRESPQAEVQRLSVDGADRPRPLEGCESALGRTGLEPQEFAAFRCFTSAPAPVNVADLR